MLEKITKIMALMIDLGYTQFEFKTLHKSFQKRVKTGLKGFSTKIEDMIRVITGCTFSVGFSDFRIDKEELEYLESEAAKLDLKFSLTIQNMDKRHDKEIPARAIFKFYAQKIKSPDKNYEEFGRPLYEEFYGDEDETQVMNYN